MDLQLNIDFNKFESRVYEYEDQLNTLANSTFNENSYKGLIQNGNDLNIEVLTFLKTSFSKSENRFLARYVDSPPQKIAFNKKGPYTEQLKSDYKSNLYSKVNALTGIRKLVSLSDILKGEKVNIENRESMRTPDIQDFVLEKLYTVFDGGYYSVQDILQLNGIPIKGSSFDTDLIISLERLGYVEKTGGARGYIARLSREGAKHTQNLIQAKAQSGYEKRRVNSTPDDETSNIKRDLNLAISTDLEKAFDSLATRINKSSSLVEDINLLSGRYTRVKRQEFKGVISYEDKRLEYNRISAALIDLVKMIKAKDIN